MKRDINQEDRQWLDLHDYLKCDLTESLVRYGVKSCYDLSSNTGTTHFFGNFILIFMDGTLEEWTVPNIHALSIFIEKL